MQIIHSDRDLTVVVKPVGLDSESAMPAAIREALGGEVYTVHRLDLNVGGVMVYAHTKSAAAALSRLIQEGTLVKEYVAMVRGVPEEKGDWTDLLWKDAKKNKVFVVKRERGGVKKARLEYTRLSTDGDNSLVRIRLHTGRSHQIRVQFASRGFPLLGDHKYGARDERTAPMLFSCCLTFPWKGQTLRFERMPEWAVLPPERIGRIVAMEELFTRASATAQPDDRDMQALAAYMDSGDWLQDYTADEQGLLPPGMKRGVLSQDGLYDLICDWEARRQAAKPVIHLFGASGSGTTTLGRAIADALGLAHLDTDDYFWLPTDPAYTDKRPIPERLAMMNADVDAAEKGAVISGSLTGWGDPLIPRFTLAVRVVTATDVRLDRLRAREYAHFGERILEGGDMHQNHEEFIAWAAQYDTGEVTMRSRACHDAWQKTLPCPVLVVDGADDLAANVARIREMLKAT